MNPVDLLIELIPAGEGEFRMEMSYTLPDSDALVTLLLRQDVRVRFDRTQLRALEPDPLAYGQALTAALLPAAGQAERALLEFQTVRRRAEDRQAPLRIRIQLPEELHDLYWERLTDPENPAAFLATKLGVLLSRYVPSADPRPVRLRPRAQLRALVCAVSPRIALRPQTADPTAALELAPFDEAAALNQARTAMGSAIQGVALTSQDKPITLDRIVVALREGYDVLYLAAHGVLGEGGPKLFLHDADPTRPAQAVDGAEFVRQLNDLGDQRPRVIFLASCDSADSPADRPGLVALGPHLADAGVPAVVAMRGHVTQQTADDFGAAFFRALARGNLAVLDEAVAAARWAVRGRPDWWRAVLFLRLENAQIGWYTPAFRNGQQQPWDSLNASLEFDTCTPVLGPGLSAPLLGHPADVARQLAGAHGFPLAPQEQGSPLQVLEYQVLRFGRNPTITRWARALYKRAASAAPGGVPPAPANYPLLAEGLRAMGRSWLQHDADVGGQDAEPYRFLARINSPLFLNADTNDLLFDALVAEGKRPRREVDPWGESEGASRAPDNGFTQGTDFVPAADEPVIFHLFGHVGKLDSLVLTEGDFFQFLRGFRRYQTTRKYPWLLQHVLSRLRASSLLLLGFPLYDWPYRMIFNVLLGSDDGGTAGSPPDGRSGNDDFKHIVAQVEPEGWDPAQTPNACQFIETFVRRRAQTDVFWGTANDFIAGYNERYG